ncbi:MAG: ABC transporter permease [Bacteroidales bacterium]|jgi:putative ABC transport system permease protein|nr:ABC transporter permease [Bacteroidales bacterium]NCU35695.1 FtsX-like permease family protein [Candidatus Falkowbacteria bacterium]MDD2632519.1 ABC transporter permease [Bacteroidales bacterium]MDD3130902.1 ABC transporter permease [Bacteroidales bacterium]MDD3527224.1 ABC transporter permease [Bacteroidales bacterium]
MRVSDMILLAFANLRRTKLRTFLTTLGVVIGIGALTSMVSFGTGMQKNITDALAANDLFTSITVTPKEINLHEIASGNVAQMANALKQESIPLTDSLLREIRNIPGVKIAYPNLEFPARAVLLGDSATTRVQAMPAAMGTFKPFDDLLAGNFFTNDTARQIILREEFLQRLKIRLQDNNSDAWLSKEDSVQGFKLVHPDSLINKTLRLVSLSMNASKIPGVISNIIRNKPEMPFDETINEMKIVGITRRTSEFGRNAFNGGVLIPIETSQKIPQLSFSSVWDLLGSKNSGDEYGSIQVRVENMQQIDPVAEHLRNMNVGVFSIIDQLDEIKRVFLILNSLLGAVGAIALIVAGLGIINTMVMSILERQREIGIMKAIGGSEKEIRMIFFTEVSVIGIIGALFGLVLGWLVTQVATVVVNTQILPDGMEPVNLFYFPAWLIVGAILFAIIISLAAGLYPAARAARIDPVRALRHD